MKALKKNDLGVSPVIAVILMVAITVVLAGVVFLWAQSFTGNEDTVTAISVDAELEYDDTVAAESTDLYITPTKGEIDWSIHKIYFEGTEVVHGLTTTTTTGATQPIQISSVAGFATVGEDYQFRIVNVENDQVVVDQTVTCKSA
jgi:flagellin-like protein